MNSLFESHSGDARTGTGAKSRIRRSNYVKSKLKKPAGKDDSSTLYVFENSDSSEEEIVFEDFNEMKKVRCRNANQTDEIYAGSNVANNRTVFKDEPEEEWEVLEHVIEPNDSLQSLSLKYSVPVFEIKRLNKFMREQDFYALRVIKIPIRKHGILSELLNQNQPQKSLECHDNASSEDDSKFVRTIHLGIGNKVNGVVDGKSISSFFNDMDQDLEKIRDSSSSYKDSLDEVTSTLTCKRFKPLMNSSSFFETESCIRWKCLIFILILFVVVIPILFYFYVKQSGNNFPFS